MPIPAWTRLLRRAKRAASFRWRGVAVIFKGNKIERETDFTRSGVKPVLLLQGFGSTRHCLLALEKRLRLDGYATFSLRLGGLFGTLNTRKIDSIARHVLAKISSLRERFGLPRITVIGHSKGGLVARYIVSCLGGSEHVAAVVTLGTPHRGLPIPHLARISPFGLMSRSLRQMRPESKLFKQLSGRPIPHDVSFVSIFSRDDAIAPPALCEIFTDNQTPHVANIEVPGMSHSDYLIKGSAYAVIRKCLTDVS